MRNGTRKSKKTAPILCAALVIAILGIYLGVFLGSLLGELYGEVLTVGILIVYTKAKPLSEITVSDLSRNFGISRTTFYRLFDNTVDVLEYACDQMGQNILLNVQGDTPKELIIQAISALAEHRELIALLCRSGHLDIFQRIQEIYLPLSTLAKGMDLDCPYFHRLLAQMIPTSIEVWLSEGQKDIPEEVYERLCRSIQMLGRWFA